jgi:hypothetical protein
LGERALRGGLAEASFLPRGFAQAGFSAEKIA